MENNHFIDNLNWFSVALEQQQIRNTYIQEHNNFNANIATTAFSIQYKHTAYKFDTYRNVNISRPPQP